MKNKILKLRKIGLSNIQIEEKAGLGNGTIARVLKTGKYRKTTEKKINKLILSMSKELINIDIYD